MVALIRRWLPPDALWALFAISLGIAGLAAYRLWQSRELNQLIAAPAGIRIAEDTPPELVFAAASFQARQGNRQEALRLYSLIQGRGDRDFQARVDYNIANLYLGEAAKLWNAAGVLEYARVNTLLELAKKNYREVLGLDPGHWDARFNLEYACRITPPPREPEKADWHGTKTSVFATLPSLPGGGP